METSASKVADGGMRIPCTSSTFIRAWLEVMRPIHRLTPKEMDVAAELIKRRYDLTKGISNPALIDKVLFNKETKDSIITKVGITDSHYKMVLHKLRQNGVIDGKKINPRYLPDWTPGKPFRWMFIFENEN